METGTDMAEEAQARPGSESGPGPIRLVIFDFAVHYREELRTVHAHARLGFADELIIKAFADNDIHLAHQAALDGGELAVKVWMGQKQGELPATQNMNLRIVA